MWKTEKIYENTGKFYKINNKYLTFFLFFNVNIVKFLKHNISYHNDYSICCKMLAPLKWLQFTQLPRLLWVDSALTISEQYRYAYIFLIKILYLLFLKSLEIFPLLILSC